MSLQNPLRLTRGVAVAALVLVAGGLVPLFGQDATPKQNSRYDRLGGTYAIATVVDDFIERLLVNDILNANPAIKEARDRVPKGRLEVPSNFSRVPGHGRAGDICRALDEGFSPALEHNRA